ncbi:hypothetical protein LR010_02200 [Candidatus Gracilibacteria bacterium]|nr:hypothetical protein [Candidatus Gracilibacteria bacterium]
MFFINILLVLHDVSFRIIDNINEKLTISLYLDEQYDKNSIEIIDLQNDIKKAIPEISITYKTKDEVLEELRERDPELVNILERQNPLPETITLEDIPLKRYEDLNLIIENKLFVLTETVSESGNKKEEYFSTYTRQFERIGKVTSILSILQIGLYVIIVTFLISIAVIIYSIIGNFIYYYKDEIYITRLVGGSKLFIYGPFSLQGMMYVGLSFIISTALFLFLLSNLKFVFGLSELSQIYTGNLAGVLFIEAIVFLLVGGVSGFLSSRRYLKK